MDVWSIFSLVVSLDTKSTALSMKERLGLQKGKPDWGELWQSTDGKGSNFCPLSTSFNFASGVSTDKVDELDSSSTKNRGMRVIIDIYFFYQKVQFVSLQCLP